MKTLIVVGGAGFIGSNFVRKALARGLWRTVVLDKLTYAGSRLNLRGLEADPHYQFVQGDINDTDALRSLVRKVNPDAIINFAAETHVDRSIDEPRSFVQTNVCGTFELLEAVRDYLARLDSARRNSFRLLHISTDEVYGSLSEGVRATEDSRYAPNSPYAASKAAADHFVRAYHETYGLPVLMTNCSNNYGPNQFPEKLIPLAISNAIAGKPIPIYGDGRNVRDWIFVEDHCDGILAVLERGRIGGRYNLGGNCERSNFELVQELCTALDELYSINRNPNFKGRSIEHYYELMTFVADRPGHDLRYSLDCALVERELGWRPSVDLGIGLRRTIRWYLENPEWCAAVQHRSQYGGERLGLTLNPVV